MEESGFGGCQVVPKLLSQCSILEKNHFLFHHDCVPVHKARSIKRRTEDFGVEELGVLSDLTDALLTQWTHIQTDSKIQGGVSQKSEGSYRCKCLFRMV